MKTRTGYFWAIISVLFVSCYTPRYMYSPSVQNVPVLVKKGDSKLSANYSPDLSGNPYTGTSPSGYKKKSHGYDLQGAVAITNNFALQVNYFNRTERNNGGDNNIDSAVINYKRKLVEIGIGYLRSMHRQDKVMFQVFGGVGKGTFSFNDKGKDRSGIYLTRNHQADVLKVFVQPAFLFRMRENFAISVSSRFSIINFSNINSDYTQIELEDYRLNDLPYGYRTFWEPAITNTFGFNKLPGVKFEYQFLTSLQISERVIDYRSFNFSIGILLDIPKIFQPGKPIAKS